MISPTEACRWLKLQGGVPPVFEPKDLNVCGEWIRQRHDQRDAVLILGGGSHLFLGNEPDRVTHILSLRRWDRIIEHSPGDLTVSVEAGCPLKRLNHELGKAGQFLPFLPPNYQHASIGGTVATALSGRYSSALGSVRELLIGIEILHTDGRLSHAGGRVVKNVAGYDLCKLYTGSMGTLGIITSATFKVRVRPPTSQTAILEFDSLGELLEAALSLRNQVVPVALEIFCPGGGFLKDPFQPVLLLSGIKPGRYGLAVELLDPKEPLKWKIQVLQKSWPQSRLLDTTDQSFFWKDWDQEIQKALQPGNGKAIVRISAPTSLLKEIHRWLEQNVPDHGLSGHVAGGTLLVFTTDIGFIEKFRTLWENQPVYTTLFKSDIPSKDGIDVWGSSSQPLPLMKQIKQKFDPHRILNPGRFWGRI